MRGVSRDSVQ